MHYEQAQSFACRRPVCDLVGDGRSGCGTAPRKSRFARGYSAPGPWALDWRLRCGLLGLPTRGTYATLGLALWAALCRPHHARSALRYAIPAVLRVITPPKSCGKPIARHDCMRTNLSQIGAPRPVTLHRSLRFSACCFKKNHHGNYFFFRFGSPINRRLACS